MISRRLKVAEFGDVHLGHPKTPTVEILKKLTRAFPANAETGELDLILLAGDFFDRLLNLPDTNVIEIRLWINRFLRLCKRYDICLRIVEGTPSHDWKQSRLFTHINELAEIGADVAYFEELAVEYIERFDIHILYVPDEWEPEADDTWLQVQELLNKRGIEKVDFSLMHGAFDYQLPEHIAASTHNPERYLSITRHLIFIGHVHRHTVRDRIIAAGSFDRLAHGEEEDKGHVRVEVDPNGEFNCTFIPTPDAKVYKTFRCTGEDVDKTLAYLEKEIGQLPDHSYVRIEAAKSDPIFVSLDTLRAKFPFIHFSTKVDKGTIEQKASVGILKERYQPIAITPDNLKKLLMERIKEKGKDPALMERVEAKLDEHIQQSA